MFALEMKWIFVILLLGFITKPTEAAWLKCYKNTVDYYIKTSLDNPTALMMSPCIDKTLPTVVYTFGYRGKSTGPATRAVLNAYLGTNKRNVLLLDWEEEARSGLLGIQLGYALYAVPNAKRIGKHLGTSLVKLANSGLNMTHLHLVGHSLGAHIMGYAGRRARESGYVIQRITGLDPARALFEGTLTLQSGLDRTCAKFVDIIHSDPGGYGTSLPSGTVDIWPNYIGGLSTQPGCPQGEFEMFTREDLCSHDRAWRYFVEAIGAPTSIIAVSAYKPEDWFSRTRRSFEYVPTIFVGDLTSTRARGNYYFTTNEAVPFSKGNSGLLPDANGSRRKRRTSSLGRILSYFS